MRCDGSGRLPPAPVGTAQRATPTCAGGSRPKRERDSSGQIVELAFLRASEEGAKLCTARTDDHVRIVTLAHEDLATAFGEFQAVVTVGVGRLGRLSPLNFHDSHAFTLAL